MWHDRDVTFDLKSFFRSAKWLKSFQVVSFSCMTMLAIMASSSSSSSGFSSGRGNKSAFCQIQHKSIRPAEQRRHNFDSIQSVFVLFNNKILTCKRRSNHLMSFSTFESHQSYFFCLLVCFLEICLITCDKATIVPKLNFATNY